MQIKSAHKKTYSYSLGDTNLSFTLDIDNEPEMRKFITLLKHALEEVKKDWENI